MSSRALTPAKKIDYEGSDCHHDENNKKNFCDAGSAGGQTRKSEYRGNYGNDKKYKGVVQHGDLLRNGAQGCGRVPPSQLMQEARSYHKFSPNSVSDNTDVTHSAVDRGVARR